MKVEQVITRYEVLSKILLKNGNDELSKELKLKLVSARVEYGKIARQYRADFEEFASALKTQELNDLIEKNDRTEEENITLQKMVNDVNDSYGTYVKKRIAEEVEVSDIKLTEGEFEEITLVNIDNDVIINDIKLSSADFIENIEALFC